MLGKKAKSRILLFVTLFISFALVIFFVLRSLEENVVYFLSPSDVYNKSDISLNETIRIGGLVKINSINEKEEVINFIITDLKNEIVVSYSGLIPNLFSEGKGVIAEGKLKDKKYFIADKILAKHDENYMPPEVKKALDQSNN
ncbi:MAG: cytochrome c-type biogenesis protein CcmE [Pelagibacterales bacterium]|nr:cytochrome c-type biogenesis protein CcmE [Pelagibacterales bacterium]